MLTGQNREIFSSLLKFMTEEADSEHAIIPFTKVQDRVVRATEISLRKITTIKHEAGKINIREKSLFFNAKLANKVYVH